MGATVAQKHCFGALWRQNTGQQGRDWLFFRYGCNIPIDPVV